MNKRLKRVFVWLIVLAMLIGLGAAVSAQTIIIPVPLDAGGFGGDSDFDFDPGGNGGGGGWGSGGDSDYSSGGSTSLEGSVLALIVIVIFVVISIIQKGKKGGKGGGRKTITPTTTQISPQHSANIANKVRAIDPFFTEAEMREKVANLYTEMQHAWEHRDWEPMRARMTDDLYSQMARQLQDLINRGYINRIERIAVMNVALKQFYQDEQHDNLTLRLTTRIVDYTIEQATGRLVSGDPKREKFMTYEWTMIRSRGVKTPAPTDDRGRTELSRNCPHCGAPIDLTQSARCSYCHSLVTAPEFDWVLSNIAGIAQQTL
ncbi:MAG TPA: Tim44 domain-containing protein [Clostridiaceae bacterium]|nr:Tim44 domain-containing protein [Clostridiaceae bacterium]